jgi:hypothetical protein
MSAGQPFTVTTSFGTPIGPTYRGSTVVVPPDDGNNIIGPIDQVVSQAITPSGDQTVYSSDIVYSKIQGFGFLATLVTAGGGTASVTVKLKGCGAAGADVTYTLTPTEGQPMAVAFPYLPSTIVANITSITVTPSADGAVVQVQGMFAVTT